MARSRKKTLSQNVVDVATTGMPQPVKKLLGKRLVALLIVLGIPVAFATGIVSLKWENGRPRIEFNQRRAAEVKQEATDQIQALKDHRADDRAPLVNIPPLVDPKPTKSLGKRIDAVKDGIDEKLERGWRRKPANGD